jgi:hypothetical protein
MSRRSDQLRGLVRDFCRQHDAWVKDDSRPHPDEAYWDAVNDLLDSFRKGDVPESCRALFKAVEAFGEQVTLYDDRENERELMPDEAFWSARQAMADVLSVADRTVGPIAPLESMQSLRALNPPASDENICKIYGLGNRLRWLIHLVQLELTTPGCVLLPKAEFEAANPGKKWVGVDGKEWRDPRLPAEEPEDDEAVSEEKDKLSRGRKNKAKAMEPCPESPRELWELGQKPGGTPITVKQAAKMLGKTEAEVAELFEQFDVEKREQLESGELVETRAQEIYDLSDQKFSAVGIAQKLNIEVSEVTAVLKKRKRQPAEA